MISKLRRSRHNDWFIQSRPCRHMSGFVAWGSRKPTDNPMSSTFFDFGENEADAIEKLRAELDGSDKMAREILA